MSTPERRQVRGDLIAAASQIGEKLERALDDPAAEVVALTTQDALLVVGLLEGAAEALRRESGPI